MHHHPSLVVLCAHHLHVLGVVVCSVLFNQVARVALGSLFRWDSLSLYTHHARFTGLLLMDSCRSLRFVHSCLWIVWLGAHYAGLTSLDRSLDYCTWTRWFHFAGWSHIVHITGWLYLQHEDQKQDNRASRGWSSVSKEDWMAPRRLAREPKDGLHGCNLSLVK